ncbi:hypothetical protein [Actinoplanes sp. NPDC049118]|uniref:hypothetical protein n=1 Tax=Actinoplanes sp. NPDC049118 TaxID=3155769 RepID=UPI0033D00BD7
MQRHAEKRNLKQKLYTRRPNGRMHTRERSRPRDNRPANGTYRDVVAAAPIDPAVARANFAGFVDRALRHARDGGMSDRDIQRVSGVATSTFHRWRSAEGRSLPKLPQVRAFCQATGASIEEALRVLGMTDSAPTATPEPPLPRDMRIILRRLTDPNTPDSEREFIRKSLQMLAGTVAADARAAERAENDAG